MHLNVIVDGRRVERQVDMKWWTVDSEGDKQV